MKFIFTLLTTLFLCSLQSQNTFQENDRNIYSPQLLKTSDNNYLLTLVKTSYVPPSEDDGSIPTHGSSTTYKVMKIDQQGNVLWENQNNRFSRLHISENASMNFESMYRASFQGVCCGGVCHNAGYTIKITTVDNQGEDTSETVNTNCEALLKSYLPLGNSRYLALADYYNDIYGSNVQPQLFFVEDDLSINTQTVIANQRIRYGYLHNDPDGNILCFYRLSSNDDTNLYLKKFDSELNLISETVLENFYDRFATSSVYLIFEILSDGKVSIIGKANTSSTTHSELITLDQNYSIINTETLPFKAHTNRLFSEDGLTFKMAHTLKYEDGTSDIAIGTYNNLGQLLETEIRDYYDIESPSYLMYDYDGNEIIMGQYNCCNLEDEGGAVAFIIFDEQTLEISDFNESPVAVFPNPVKNILNISISNEEFNSSGIIEMYDINGKQVKREPIRNSTIDLSSINDGLYFYSIHTGENVYTGKVIKKTY